MASDVPAQPAPSAEDPVITIDLTGCARCDSDQHKHLIFRKLYRPVIANGQNYTHWASCPTNGQPVIMRVEDAEK